jgi:hypothetical protein
MIVRITVAATPLDCVVGAGDGAPQVGMSPAIAETERTQVKVSATRNRFMVVAPIFES